MKKILLILLFCILFQPGHSLESYELFNRPITAVSVSGNLVYSTEYILKTAKVTTARGYLLNPGILEEDQKKIFAMGTFQKVGVVYEPAAGGVRIIFHVQENPLVKQIKLKDCVSLDSSKLELGLRNRLNEQLNFNYLDEDIRWLNNQFKQSYFDLSSVSKTEFSDNTTLTFEITEPHINEIIITGNTYTKTELILREFSKKKGDIYNSAALQTDRNKIFNLGYFSRVSLPEITPAVEQGGVDVKIEVTEKKKNSVNFGLGITSGEQFGFLRLSLLNMLNTGEQMYFRFQSGQEHLRTKTNYSIRYFNPWFFQKNLSFGYTRYLKFGYEQLRNSDQSTDLLNIKRDGFSLDLGFPLFYNNKFRFITEYRDETVDEAVDYPIIHYTNQSLAGTFIYDGQQTISDGFIVVDGELFKVRYEKGGRLALFNQDLINFRGVDFSRIDIMYNRFIPLNEKTTLGFHYKTGSFESDRSKNILEGEEYAIGGTNTVRGYPDITPFAIGPKMTLINLEYRYMFNPQWQGVLFYDWGDAYTDTNISIKEFKSGYGLGLRIILPFGPLRFDLGRGEQFWIFHFGLGHAF